MAPVPDSSRPSFAGLDAVIFDMDGVVTDTAVVHAAAWKKLFDAYLEQVAMGTGADVPPFDERADYERYVDGKNRYDGVRSFLESRGIRLPDGSPHDPAGSDTVCAMGNDKDNYFLEHVREHGVRAYESTVRLIRDLREKGVKTGLVSASRNAEEVLSSAGVADLFDVRVDGVVAAELDLPGKPDPATFLEAARRLGVEPACAAVVEDACPEWPPGGPATSASSWGSPGPASTTPCARRAPTSSSPTWASSRPTPGRRRYLRPCPRRQGRERDEMTTTTDFLTAQRRELLARRQAYLAEAERATAAALELTDDAAGQDIADEDGFGEGDTVSVERDRLTMVATDAQARVVEIDAAIGRLDAGTYGTCEACGNAIPVARLDAIPEATLCVSCKTGANLRRR